MISLFPEEVVNIARSLESNGFEAYLVGGCVRDLFRDKVPKDWDITTNATPDEIMEIFKHSHCDNEYGTVRVVNDDTEDKTLKVIEVTTYRLEAQYSDGRRPDNVVFSRKLEDDLKRRDFTINAIALKIPKEAERVTSREILFTVVHETVVDKYGGLKDLSAGIIRTVGDPDERFREDALRILRAIRLAVELDFEIESETEKALAESSHMLKNISVERIRDEFVKIIMSDHPRRGIELMQKMRALQYVVPELERTIDIEQNKSHKYNLWEHSLRALQATAEKEWGIEVRLSALFHDISKVETRKWEDSKKDWTFYNHEVSGSYVVKNILNRLKFSKEIINNVFILVRWHMFFSDTEKITLSAVRRLIRNVGKERVWDLMSVRVADRIGMGRPKEKPYRLRKYHSMIEEAMRDPVSVGMLEMSGKDIMEITGFKPSPQIGWILHALLEDVLDNPKNNNKKYLTKKTKELSKLSQEELKELGEEGKITKKEKEEREIWKLRGKYGVK